MRLRNHDNETIDVSCFASRVTFSGHLATLQHWPAQLRRVQVGQLVRSR